MFILLGLVVNRSLPGNCMIADNPVRIIKNWNNNK
jgi:serine acetyltransferase